MHRLIHRRNIYIYIYITQTYVCVRADTCVNGLVHLDSHRMMKENKSQLIRRTGYFVGRSCLSKISYQFF